MQETGMESFGKWVRGRRRTIGLTQKALGNIIGYAEITVRQVESDTYSLTRFVEHHLQLWNYPRVLIGLGRVRLVLGNIPEAVAYLTVCTRCDGRIPVYRFSSGLLH